MYIRSETYEKNEYYQTWNDRKVITIEYLGDYIFRGKTDAVDITCRINTEQTDDLKCEVIRDLGGERLAQLYDYMIPETKHQPKQPSEEDTARDADWLKMMVERKKLLERIASGEWQ